MNTARRILLAALALFATAASLSAQTVAYWRFDDEEDIRLDSSGNGHDLTLSPSSTTSYSAGRLAKPASSNGWLGAPDNAAFTMNAFTLELNLELSTHNGSLTFVAGQWAGSNGARSYTMALSASREFGVILSSDGNTAGQYYSGVTLETGVNYYLAVAVNTSATESERSITFHVKDLTNNTALQSISYESTISQTSLWNSNTGFGIGAQGTGGAATVFSGYLDEIRLSAGVLSGGQLLVSGTIPEPSAFAALAGLAAAAFAGAHRRRC